ncbi:DUF423 domain-containing protein [Flavobacterium sp. HXWNR69]|uniref:DUF423 domain-containing protein n=1 Tax=Flavobacterium fragile TaxID=2949085 RepID=A0ABT0TE98_9FLAO|nr:DUF423 domain-containing protein [Flavobacterium sp. HXWNR69]MCL9768795.1 DUF423 domain-containing protein [Flavobacterium sp. HXWNR69]
MDKKILLVAAFLGVTAIILGAFGAHALKKVLSLEQLATFEVGVRYQMYHALFLLFLGSFAFLGEKERTIIFYLTITGVLFFSGSIYFLATNTITNLKTKFLGPITPVGGLFLITAWGYLFYSMLTKKQ